MYSVANRRTSRTINPAISLSTSPWFHRDITFASEIMLKILPFTTSRALIVPWWRVRAKTKESLWRKHIGNAHLILYANSLVRANCNRLSQKWRARGRREGDRLWQKYLIRKHWFFSARGNTLFAIRDALVMPTPRVRHARFEAAVNCRALWNYLFAPTSPDVTLVRQMHR